MDGDLAIFEEPNAVMLLTYPEWLWGLLALIIPILIHLFRLRRFRKTPFTNVSLLQKLVVESNRSSTLKKWLLLACRMGLLAAFVLAFTQPYTARPGAETAREVVVYLDNSFSMQNPQGNANLLQNAVQSLLQNLPPETEIAVLTNTEQFSKRPLRDLRETLLGLPFTHQRSDAASLMLRAQALFEGEQAGIREFWLLSDFQDLDLSSVDSTAGMQLHVLPLRPENRYNVSLDTAFISNRSPEILELQVAIRLDDPERKKPLSLFNGDTLIAKSAPEVDEDGRGTALFSLPAQRAIEGSVRILDEGLDYDNDLYFALNIPPKIRVLSLGDAPARFLERIFTPDEFTLQQWRLQETDFAELENQHLVILNELAEIPAALSRQLTDYATQGGTLLVIPPPDGSLKGYATFLRALGAPSMGSRVDEANRITEIAFGHPLYKDVFETEVRNFDYPTVQSYYRMNNRGDNLLSFQNGEAFLRAAGRVYVFAGPLNPENSNFIQSPLIVPTFYAIGRQSMPFSELYYTVGQAAELELDAALEEDRIFRLESPDYAFIPRQESFARKTRLSFQDEPARAGNYQVVLDGNKLRTISFNLPRSESSAGYPELVLPANTEQHGQPEALWERYQNETRITPLWKWFVILALLFVAAELILQKAIR